MQVSRRIAIMDVILYYNQERSFRVSHLLSVRRNDLFPLYWFFRNFIWTSCFYHLSSLRYFSYRWLFAYCRPQRIPIVVLVVVTSRSRLYGEKLSRVRGSPPPPSESTSQRSLISQKRFPFSQKPPALAHPLIRDFKIQRRDGHENFA